MLSQVLLALVAFAPSSLAAPSSSTSQKPSSIDGPVMIENFPDPAIIQVKGKWYAFATNDGVHHVQIATSNNFETWTYLHQDALPTVGAWSNGNNVWAPDVIQVVRTLISYTPQLAY
jgi:beta-xylosidase